MIDPVVRDVYYIMLLKPTTFPSHDLDAEMTILYTSTDPFVVRYGNAGLFSTDDESIRSQVAQNMLSKI